MAESKFPSWSTINDIAVGTSTWILPPGKLPSYLLTEPLISTIWLSTCVSFPTIDSLDKDDTAISDSLDKDTKDVFFVLFLLEFLNNILDKLFSSSSFKLIVT